MNQVRYACLAASLLSAFVYAADPTISVEARQRYPWNGMVDLSFTVAGDAGTKYDTSFVAKDVVGGTNLPMRTLMDANGAALSLTNSLMPGSYKWIWNASADLPSGYACNRVTLEGAVAHRALYMVIDVSGGSSASVYPVSYLDEIPDGGWQKVHKTSKIVLRYVDPGTFQMGSPVGENCRSGNENRHTVTISKGYYIGVFELTAKQYELIMGGLTYRPYPNQSGYAWVGFYHGTGTSGWEVYPMEDLKYYKIRGNNVGLSKSTVGVDADSLVGLLRSRTGFSAIDLPTEAQWEFACRAGTSTALYTGKDIPHSDSVVDSSLTPIAVYYRTEGTMPVGSKSPNSLGLYDMYGNVWEWCLDWYQETLTDSIDPLVWNSSGKKICRGGGYGSPKNSCRSACRVGIGSDSLRPPAETYCCGTEGALGVRLCVNIE